MAIANYILSPLNTAKLYATLSATEEDASFPASNLIAERTELSWVTPNLGHHATRLLIDYGSAEDSPEETRAVHLDRGVLPTRGTRYRVTRGDGIAPRSSPWIASSSPTNAANNLPHGSTPGDTYSAASPYLGPSAPLADWSLTLDLAEPEWDWSPDRDQILVIVAASSAASGDGSLQVEVRNSASNYPVVPLDVAQVTGTADEGAVRLAYRLIDSDISSPPQVRLTGLAGTSADVRVYSVQLINPVILDTAPQTTALRPTGAIEAQFGSVDASGVATCSEHFRSPQLLEDAGAGVTITGGVAGYAQLTMASTGRDRDAATLYASIEQSAIGQQVAVDLYQDGALLANLGTATSTSTGPELYTFASPLSGSLRQIAIRISQVGPGQITRIGPVAIDIDYSDPLPSEAYDHDTGWITFDPPTTAATGSHPVDDLGPTAKSWRRLTAPWVVNGLESVGVTAAQTLIDIDIVADPDDPRSDISAIARNDHQMRWHEIHEGPGLSGVKLERGFGVSIRDLTVVHESLGGFVETVPRRGTREEDFSLVEIREDVDLEELVEIIERVGRSRKILLVALPSRPGLKTSFSILGTLGDRAEIQHMGGLIVQGSFSIGGA